MKHDNSNKKSADKGSEARNSADDDNLLLSLKGEFDFLDQNAINIVNKGPRRPLSPYIFFSQEKRKDLKKEHPEWTSQ